MNSYKELTWFLQIQRIKLFLAVDDGWVVVKKNLRATFYALLSRKRGSLHVKISTHIP